MSNIPASIPVAQSRNTFCTAACSSRRNIWQLYTDGAIKWWKYAMHYKFSHFGSVHDHLSDRQTDWSQHFVPECTLLFSLFYSINETLPWVTVRPRTVVAVISEGRQSVVSRLSPSRDKKVSCYSHKIWFDPQRLFLGFVTGQPYPGSPVYCRVKPPNPASKRKPWFNGKSISVSLSNRALSHTQCCK